MDIVGTRANTIDLHPGSHRCLGTNCSPKRWIAAKNGSGCEHQTAVSATRVHVVSLLGPREEEAMSGIDDLLAQSNDRWAHAVRRAHGIDDKGLGEAVRTYYTRYFPAGLLVLVAAGTLAGMLGFGAAPSDWPSYLIFGIFLAALGVVVGGLIYNSTKLVPAARVGRVDVLLSLESEERKQIRRQIAGKAAVDPEHLSVARASAVQLRKGLATQLLLAPFFVCVFIPQAARLTVRGDPFSWFMAVGVVGVLIGMAFLIRDFRRTGRFLARTSEG